MNKAKCAVYNVKCAVYNVKFAVYNVKWAVYYVKSAVHNVVCCVQFAVFRHVLCKIWALAKFIERMSCRIWELNIK